jgi:hypothetical protein
VSLGFSKNIVRIGKEGLARRAKRNKMKVANGRAVEAIGSTSMTRAVEGETLKTTDAQPASSAVLGRGARFRLRTLLVWIAAFALVFGVAQMVRRRFAWLQGAATLARRESSARLQEAVHQRRAATVRRWAEDWRAEGSSRRQTTDTGRDRCARLAEYWDDRAADFAARASRSRGKAERIASLRSSYLRAADRPWGPPPRASLEDIP